jgi:hypothetical protein
MHSQKFIPTTALFGYHKAAIYARNSATALTYADFLGKPDRKAGKELDL